MLTHERDMDELDKEEFEALVFFQHPPKPGHEWTEEEKSKWHWGWRLDDEMRRSRLNDAAWYSRMHRHQQEIEIGDRDPRTRRFLTPWEREERKLEIARQSKEADQLRASGHYPTK